VAEVAELTPNLRQVVLQGGLVGFVSIGGDQFVYLMVRRGGGAELPADHTLSAQLDADPRTGPMAAYCTVRSWDARARRLTLWMVRHGHDGVGRWADRCEIGERVALWGPRRVFDLPSGASSYLFVTDESGLGALAALLDELPDRAAGYAIIETVDSRHVIDLPAPAGIAVTWLYRGDDEPGSGARLLDAVRALDLTSDAEGRLVAFGAGESGQMTRIRNYLRREIGLSAADVSMTGYWRRARPKRTRQ
jgi:NADPH-dependent ferric siderophore reductase